MSSLANCIRKVTEAATNIPLDKKVKQELLAKASQYLREDWDRIQSGAITQEQAEMNAANRALSEQIESLKQLKVKSAQQQTPPKSQPKSQVFNPFIEFKKEMEYYNRLRNSKIDDKRDSKTTKLISMLRSIHLGEAMMHLERGELKEFLDYVTNIYRSRSSSVSDPAIRKDSDKIYEHFLGVKQKIDKIMMERMIEDNSFLDLSDLDINKLTREELLREINLRLKAFEAGEMAGVKQSKSQERLEKKQSQWRAALHNVQALFASRGESADDYLDRLEEINGQDIHGANLRVFLKTHVQYITTIDPERLSGMDLYRHMYSMQALLDGKFTYFGDTTVKHIQRVKDEQLNIESLRTLFRDPISGKTPIGKAFDMLTSPMELKQVYLERFSAFKEGQQFLQEDVMGDFFQSLVLDAENDKRASLDEYITKKTELEKNNKREFDEKDRIIGAMLTRLIQFRHDINPDAAILDNIQNERQSIDNVIQNGDYNEQLFYQKFIKPTFEMMVKGVEGIGRGAYDEFMNTIAGRAAAGDSAAMGQARVDLVQMTLDIVNRYSYSSEIISEGFYNTAFERYAHYFPRFTISLDKQGQQANPNAGMEAQAELLMESQFTSNSFTAKPGQYEARKGIGDKRHYSNNIEYIFERFITAATFNIHTTSERMVLNERLKKGNPLFEILTEQNKEVDTDEARTRRVQELKEWAREVVSSALNRGQAMGKFGDIMRSINRAYARVALSSVHQGITQSLSAITDYGIRTGNWSGTMKAFTFIAQNYKDVDRFFKNNARWVYNRALLGEIELDQRRNPEFDEKSLSNSKFMKVMRKAYDGADKFILFSLRAGDIYSARAIVLAEYARLMKLKGNPYDSIFDVDLTYVDGKTLTQAILNAEKNVNTSNKALRGEFFTDRRMIYTLFRNSLFAFSGHIMSLSSQFTKAARDIHHLKSIGAPKEAMYDKARTMGAILAQTFIFSSGRYLINMGLATALIALIRDLYDDEEGKIASLKANIRRAQEVGDPVAIEIAQSELTNAERIKNIVGRMESQTTTFDGYIKGVLRDELGAIHVLFNGPQALQKAVFAIPDMFSKQAYDKAKEDQIAALKIREREARDMEDFPAADRIYEQIKTVQDTDYIPFSYDNYTNIGIGGLYGSSLGHIYSTYEKAVQAMGGERELNYADFILAAQSLGFGQNDVSKFLKRVSMIEKEMAEERKRLRTEGIPKAQMKKVEDTEKAREKAQKRFLASIFQ